MLIRVVGNHIVVDGMKDESVLANLDGMIKKIGEEDA